MVVVEAQSYGRPVIAYGRGGALETIDGAFAGECIEPNWGRTGIFFEHQSIESLSHAMLAFEGMEAEFVPAATARHAARYSTLHFERAMREFLDEKLGLAARETVASSGGLSFPGRRIVVGT